MSIFKAIQVQAFRDKLALSLIKKAPSYTLESAVLGKGWLKTENGKQVPDLSLIPTNSPITAVPGEFKAIPEPVFDYVNGKLTVNIEASDFAVDESHEYNIVGIKDSTGEIAMILIGQPAYISAERPLIVNATFEDRITVIAS